MRISVPSAGADIDLARVDLTDPHFYSNGDPHSVWHAMRERTPLHRQTLPNGRSFVSVTRHADVRAVLADHARFTSRRGTLLSILGHPDPAADKMMAASDPPVHSAMREPMARVMSYAALRDRRDGIRHVVHRLLQPLLAGEPWDLANAVLAFPMAFTGALMGLPQRDWPRLAELTTMAIAPEDGVVEDVAAQARLATAHHELFEYFAVHVQTRRSRDDLVGFLTQMRLGERGLRMDEIVYNCYSLLLGANVTTPHAIAATVLALTEHPEQYPRGGLAGVDVDRAVDEGLRWSSPANHFLRHATVPTELSGGEVRPGEAVVAWLGSANRDEHVFTDPYAFDIERSPNRHLAFGFGRHYCIGAPLAKIALGVFFEELFALVTCFRVVGPPEHLASNFVAGVKRLLVVADLHDGAAEVLRRAHEEQGPLPQSQRT